MTIIIDRVNCLNVTDTNIFLNEIGTKKRLCWLSADLSLVLSITEFWNLTRLSQPTCIASNRMKCRLSYAKYVRHLLIDEVQFCFMKILGRMLALQKLPYLEYEILSHIPYSPYLPPTDYDFCNHIDNNLTHRHSAAKIQKMHSNISWRSFGGPPLAIANTALGITNNLVILWRTYIHAQGSTDF